MGVIEVAIVEYGLPKAFANERRNIQVHEIFALDLQSNNRRMIWMQDKFHEDVADAGSFKELTFHYALTLMAGPSESSLEFRRGNLGLQVHCGAAISRGRPCCND